MHLIKSFYRDNKKSLTTLTAGDVVFGELDNKQFKASTVAEMLKADTIQITVETSKGLIEKSVECTNHVETLFEGDNWEDNDLLNKIIDLSKTCGNVIKNKAVPTSLSYKREHYFTTLFGGLYIFKGAKKTTIIVKDPLLDLKHHGLKTDKFEIIYLYKKDEIYAFLKDNDYLEKISFDKLKEKTPEFDLKLLHTVLDKYIEKDGIKNFSYLNKSAIKNFIADNYDELSNDFYNIEEFVTCIHTDDKSCLSRNEFSQYCYQVKQDLRGADISLISHLLCNFKPYSNLTLFIYNRGLFEKLFNKWSAAKQEYVKTYLYDHSNILNDLRNRIDVE
jgi:hypothetical protein